MQLPDRIKKIRLNLELSQLEFSTLLGVSRGHISNIETGAAVPSEQLINLICATWGVDKEWLQHGHGEMKIRRKSNITAQEWEDMALEDIDRHKYDALINYLSFLYDSIKNYTNFLDSLALSYEANFDTLLDPDNDRNKHVAKRVEILEKEIRKMMEMIRKLTTVPPDEPTNDLTDGS